MANTDEWWKPANKGNVIFFPAILGGNAQIISLIDPLQKKKSFPANYLLTIFRMGYKEIILALGSL